MLLVLLDVTVVVFVAEPATPRAPVVVGTAVEAPPIAFCPPTVEEEVVARPPLRTPVALLLLVLLLAVFVLLLLLAFGAAAATKWRRRTTRPMGIISRISMKASERPSGGGRSINLH